MANKVYFIPEGAITWMTSGGTHKLDLNGLTALTGVRVGARHDFGVLARPQEYEWRIQVDGFAAAPVVDEAVDLYGSTSNGTIEDGNVGIIDAASSTVVLPNVHYTGSVKVQTTTAADPLNTSGRLWIISRYWSPVVHNKTANDFSTDTHILILTPIPPQIQIDA